MASKTMSVAASETTAAPEPPCEPSVPQHAFGQPQAKNFCTSNRARPCQLEHSRTLTLSGLQLDTDLDNSDILLSWLFACNQTHRTKMLWSSHYLYVLPASLTLQYYSIEHVCLFLRSPTSFPLLRTTNPTVIRFHTSENTSRHDDSKNNTTSIIQKITWCIKRRTIPKKGVWSHDSLFWYLCFRNEA